MKVKIGSQTYFVSFRHFPVPFGNYKRPPTREELMKALSCAGAVLEGILSAEIAKLGGVDVSALVGEALARLIGEKVTHSHQSECLIRDEYFNLVSSGAALCDKRDQFERPMGRLVSFVKAVSAFPAADHEAFFTAYADSGMNYPDTIKALKATRGFEWRPLVAQASGISPEWLQLFDEANEAAA